MLTGLIGVVIGLLGIGIGKYMKKKNEQNMQLYEERKKQRELENKAS